MSDGWTRWDDHPVAEMFRRVCHEQLGSVPRVECRIKDDTDADVMDIVLTTITGLGRQDFPFTLQDQAQMTTPAWERSIRREFRRWFKDAAKRKHA